MSVGDFAAGLAFFVGTWGCVLAAALLVVRRRLPHLPAVEAVLAVSLVATAGVIAAHLLPGLVGLLSRTSALVVAVALLAGATRVPAVAARPPASSPPLPSSGRASWVLAGMAVAAVSVAGLAAAWSGAVTPSVEVDTLSFHLPNVARWIQSGTFWRVDVFAPLQPTGYYPNNGDVVVLSAVLPWRNDAFVRALGLPFAAVAGLSVYALATEARAPRATAALLAALFTSVPAFAIESYEGAKTDPVMLASFGAGLLFLVRHLRTRASSELVLAGLGLGLAFGTKWYGATNVAVVLVAWAAVWLLLRGPPRALVRTGLALVALVAAAGGFWLVRNAVESGNPVFPVELTVLGATLIDAPRDVMRECAGFSISDYLDTPRIWADYFFPAWRDMLGPPGLACAIGWLGALVLLARRLLAGGDAARRELATPLLLAASVALLVLVYALTPYSAFGPEGLPTQTVANVRWLMPAVLAAAALAAWAVGGVGRLRLAAEVALLVAVADGIRRGFSDPPAAVLGAAAVLAVAAGVALLLVRRRSPVALAGAAAAAALAIAAAGYERQRDFNDDRYGSGDPAIGWLARHAPAGRRVGLAGSWDPAGISPVWPAFGPRLRNEVAFVGRFVDHHLFEHATRGAFLRAVQRGRYDLLLVGKAGDPDPELCRIPGAGTDENAWAREAGFRKLAESGRLTLYRVTRQ